MSGGPVIFAQEQVGRCGHSLLENAPDHARAMIYRAIHDGCVGLLRFFQLLHKRGLFLTRQDASDAAGAMNLFCQTYTYLARSFFDLGLCRYHLEPTLHMCRHVSYGLEQVLQTGAPVLVSPGAWLCEQSEDFVGKISRITRRVSARLCAQRTLQRYLVKVFLEWERLGV